VPLPQRVRRTRVLQPRSHAQEGHADEVLQRVRGTAGGEIDALRAKGIV
jgi:hypothetical protein